jgi:aspartate kinase
MSAGGIRVMKFGGTSVATPESRRRAASLVISAREKGHRPVVVVSAIGREGSPYATDTLLRFLQSVDPAVEPDPRETDLMVACGEILSAVVFAHTLKTLGHPAHAYRGGQAGIRTDGVFGNARVVSIDPQLLFECLESGAIPVVCGFQGTYVPRRGVPGGELTTLGRGGSDTTAAAIGAAMKASAVEVYTDVDGVKTADPDYVPDAPTLAKVTYDEVAEIAHLGAKVLHPRAAEIAMKFGIPLWVKSTMTDGPGTEVVARESLPGRRVTGVTHTGKLVYLQFNLAEALPEHRSEIEAKVYQTMARYELNLYMMSHSPDGFGMAIDREHFSIAEDLIDGLVLPVAGDRPAIHIFQMGQAPSLEAETQMKLLSELGMVKTIRIELTENAQIPVLQTTDSEFSLGLLVPEVDGARAVQELHRSFVLGEAL